MSRLLLDYQFASQIGSRLDGFTRIRDRLWLARCPFCGDSSKSKKKRRFYIYWPTKHGFADHLSTSCHNCGYGNSFGRFLEEFDPGMYNEYRLELFKIMGWGRKNQTQEPVVEEPKEDPPPEPYLDLPTISDLPDNHPAKAYVLERRLPAWTHDYLQVTEDFREDFQDFSAETVDMYLPDDMRIIIPFYNEWNELQTVQGRAVDKACELRYITLKRHPGASKVFGLDRLNKSKTILVVEGPIDSMFLPNCIATADADLMSAGIGDVFIPDSQYRNHQICDRIEKMINAGKKVTLFPNNFPWKDINDCVTKGNMSPRDLIQLIGTRTFHGLAAKMEFSKLRKDVRPENVRFFRS